MKGFTTAAAGAAIALALGGCAYNAGSADYRAYEARGEQSVRFGVVETVRPVRIRRATPASAAPPAPSSAVSRAATWAGAAGRSWAPLGE